jgi:hypothetical protein
MRALVGWMMALWCCLTTDAAAATYDPKLRWRTITTEHFRIHFHQGLEQLAEEMSAKVEEIYGTMSGELQWAARMKTDVVLTDRTDRANGFASAVPYNAITIFVTAPWEDSTLSLYEDWGEAIFTHELTHVLHMESNHGIVSAARAVIGRIASTNDVSPPWMIEGLATFQETRHTAGGRGRTPYVDMIKRTAMIEDQWPALGNLDGLQARVPAGNLRYLFGQDFMQYVADHTGEDVWTRWIHIYGGHIPYFLPAKQVFGTTLQSLYYQWRLDRRAKYAEEVQRIEAVGVREGVIISEPEASCSAPAFAPDDSRLIWSCYDNRTGNALWTAEGDGSGAKILKQDFGAKSFTWRADAKAFVYATTHLVNRFNTWSDVYLFDVASGKVKALTSGARARDPDFSPDGSHLLVVTNHAQDNQLEVMTVDQRRTKLTEHTDHTQYSTPRYSPDGRAIAISIWEDGQRDLWLIAPDGARLRRLTFDQGIDRDPAWSADGRWLFFASDRTGIPNIFAIEIETERLWQVTNVRTGAARPSLSPDFTRLAYDHYSADGWDVRLMPVDPAQFIDHGLLAAPITGGPPLASLVTVAPRATAMSAPGEARPEAAGSFAAAGPPPSPAGSLAPSETNRSPGGLLAPPRALAPDATRWDGPVVRARGPGPRPSLNAADPQDSDATGTFQIAQVKDLYGDEADYPFTLKPKRYSPARALLPRYWVPSFNLTPRLPETPDNDASRFFATLPPPLNLPGFQFTASTGSADPLRHVGYSAWLSYRTDADFWGGGAALTISKLIPVFSLSASTSAVPRVYTTLDEDDDEATAAELRSYFERRVQASFVMSYPVTIRSTVFTTYDFSDRRALTPIAADADPSSIALIGTTGKLSFGYRYAWSQPTAFAVSQEDARQFSLVAGITAPWLGAGSINTGVREPITQIQLSAELREYVVNPWVPNHVLALRFAAGVALNLQGEQFLGNYALGGNVGDGGFYVRPAEYRMIRGYPFGADRGDTYWLAGAEYRFPIFRFDRGFGTVPAFFRALHGAAFVDAGNAFTDVASVVDVFDDALVGVGAELRLDTVILWSTPLDFRLGWAVGLTQPGLAITPTQARSVYLQFGGAF